MVLVGIRPYKTVDNKIEGAVLALFDIDQVKQSEQRVRLARQYADAILEGTTDPFVMLDGELRIQSANNAFGRMVSAPAAELEGRPLDEVGGGHWDVSALRAALGRFEGDTFSSMGYRCFTLAPVLRPENCRSPGGPCVRWMRPICTCCL